MLLQTALPTLGKYADPNNSWCKSFQKKIIENNEQINLTAPCNNRVQKETASQVKIWLPSVYIFPVWVCCVNKKNVFCTTISKQSSFTAEYNKKDHSLRHFVFSYTWRIHTHTQVASPTRRRLWIYTPPLPLHLVKASCSPPKNKKKNDFTPRFCAYWYCLSADCEKTVDTLVWDLADPGLFWGWKLRARNLSQKPKNEGFGSSFLFVLIFPTHPHSLNRFSLGFFFHFPNLSSFPSFLDNLFSNSVPPLQNK